MSQIYKIYREGNYIRVVDVLTNELFNGAVKDVFIDKSNVQKNEYTISKIKDFDETNTLSIGKILKSDDTAYSISEWETFYTENTGNFNGGGAAPETLENKVSIYTVDGTGEKYYTADYINETTTQIDGLETSKENVANKATDFSTVNNTLYPTIQASKNYTDFKALDNVLFENRQAVRDFYKAIALYSINPTSTLIGVTGFGDSMSEGMPLAFTRTLGNYFPIAGLVSGGFGLASALSDFTTSGTIVYNGRALLTGVDYTYVPNGNHIEMANGAILSETTGQSTGFTKVKVIFATSDTSGSAFVELLNKDTGVVLDSGTINLNSVSVGATKIEFNLSKSIKYKIRITATDKVLYLFSAFLKPSGIIPFHMGKGGSSFAQNISSNKTILSYIVSEMNLSMAMLMAKEPVPSPDINSMMGVLTTYFPNSSKIIFASLPDSRTPSVVIEENRVLKEAALGSGFAWFDTYKVNKDYAELVRLGQNGDGTHPTIQPYEYANQLLFTELGFDNSVGALIKIAVNHTGTNNTIITNKLNILDSDSSENNIETISSAGGANIGKVFIKNVRTLSLGAMTGTTPGIISYGSSVAAVIAATDALTTLRAKNLDIADATANSAINGNLTVGKLLKMTTTPTTSAAGYDILTRHTTTNAIEKVPSSTFATTLSPTFTGTPTAPTAAPGTTGNQIATVDFVIANAPVRPYKVYTALLSQTGTSAPTATVLENTLGGTVVWTRVGNGSYRATLTGAFVLDKTTAQITGNNTSVILAAYRASDDIVAVNTQTLDDSITKGTIEIRVYN